MTGTWPALGWLLACAPATGVPVEPAVAEPACLETWRVTAADGVLAEQRRHGAPLADFPTGYAAAAITPDHVPVAAAALRIGGAPVFFLTPDRSAVAVDGRYLGDLVTVDLTALSPGDRVEVGVLTEAARSALAPRALVAGLIGADVLRIYAHVEGEACLRGERTDGGVYTASIDGEHVYFTSGENRASFAADVTVGADGRITVAGRAPR